MANTLALMLGVLAQDQLRLRLRLQSRVQARRVVRGDPVGGERDRVAGRELGARRADPARQLVADYAAELRAALTSNPLSMLGALLASGGLRKLRNRMDPGAINGGPLLGLGGIVVKSHGGADAKGYAAAIRVAIDLARSDFLAEIERNMERLTAAMADRPQEAVQGVSE